MKTYSARAGDVGRRWFVVDAEGQVLGRLATRIATVLRGKHKPPFTPHIDVGDFVVVVNAEKVKLTGQKLDSKLFRRHSGYPGGLKEIPYRRLLATHPERAIERAVWGMLPKGRLGRQLKTKLKVYAGPDHPHSSQKPEPLDIQGPIPVYVDPEPKPTRNPAKAKAKADRQAKAKTAPPTARASRRKPATGKQSAARSKGRKASSRKPAKPKEN
jgi:large subunit ribosomal protein L13